MRRFTLGEYVGNNAGVAPAAGQHRAEHRHEHHRAGGASHATNHANPSAHSSRTLSIRTQLCISSARLLDRRQRQQLGRRPIRTGVK